MKLIKDKTLKEKYESGKLKTTNIYNFRKILFKRYDKPKYVWKLIETISGDNRIVFANIFGRFLFYYKNEFNYHVWCVEFKEHKFLIMNAKDYGTTFEVFREDGKEISEEIVLLFFKQMYHKIKEEKEKNIL
jgi:hypothetical protein